MNSKRKWLVNGNHGKCVLFAGNFRRSVGSAELQRGVERRNFVSAGVHGPKLNTRTYNKE